MLHFEHYYDYFHCNFSVVLFHYIINLNYFLLYIYIYIFIFLVKNLSIDPNRDL